MNSKNQFVIRGLGGRRTLKGTVSISGAKNAALKAVAAAILFDGPVRLENVPENSDMRTITSIVQKMGGKVEWKENNDNKSSSIGGHVLIVDATDISSTTIDEELAKGMRGSVVLTGPMLARFKKVRFPAPGGCVIGARPIDLFLSGYEKMNATVDEHDCVYDISSNTGLTGTEITFKKISVGATETLMMAAVLAQGTTVLNNCAREPEIVNVAEWLNSSGANISGVGTSTITIVGTNGKLLSAKQPFITIPDRITAGSFLILGALCAEELTIDHCRPDHLNALITTLTDCGVRMEIKDDSITVRGNTQDQNLLPIIYKSVSELRTQEYPGFPTDLQSPMVTFLTQCDGKTKVVETIFEGRFKYVEDLIKIGAKITAINPHEIMINGPSALTSSSSDAELTAHDIRAGFAIVLAALVGEGKFTVSNVHLIDRGYEKLEETLKKLGANIERVAN